METTTKEEWLAELARLFPAEIVGFKRPEDGVPTDLEFGTYLPPLIAKDGVKCDQINAYLRQLLSSDKDLKANTEAIKNQLANCDLRVVTETLKGLMGPDMLKKLNGIQAGALNNPHPATHPATIISQDATHRFATDAEKNTWNGKANASHGNHVPTTQTANNAVFLRNDNTWQAVTPGNVGAYTKGEIDGKVNTINTAINGKANASHGNHVPATQGANNTVFLRNDNSWQAVTPGNIGAAPTNHAHTGAQIDAPRGDQNKDLNTAREIRWRNFGNSHTIVDASGGHYPGGNQNAQNIWQPTYPTLVGYNGSQTYGVRVDSARVADSAGAAPANGGNADTVDGLHAHGGRNTEGNKLVRTNGSGYIDVGYINSNNGVENGNITNLIYDNGDGYYRKCSLAHLISKINAGGGGGVVASSLAQNGYVKFACGLILQWGAEATFHDISSGNPDPSCPYETNFLFPISFPSKCLRVVPSIYSIDNPYGVGYIKNPTLAGFTMRWGEWNSPVQDLNGGFVAIGV